MTSTEHHHVVVIVLGDIGRSPRMQYHTLSLLENGFSCSLIGYTGEALIPQLDVYLHPNLPSIKPRLFVFRFKPHQFPSLLRLRLMKPIYFILRGLNLLWMLLYILFIRIAHLNVPVQCVLVQNPPSVPLLFISWIYCKICELMTGRHVGLIIDWHNLGFSMFDMSQTHPIRTFVRRYEIFMAKRADCHFCVTKGMKDWLLEHALGPSNSKVPIRVLYDRPPNFFQPTKLEDMHSLMKKLNSEFLQTCPLLMQKYGIKNNSDRDTLLTLCDAEDRVVLRNDRPSILVSSTSWTPDEDFGILLEALIQLDTMVVSTSKHLLVIVTGKGPQKAMYMEKIANLSLTNITIQTMWLEAGDYPRLLGCADLGVSLHTSTSGIDLPMKVVDMFGCQVPVCAMGFDCIDELVQDTVNGRIFKRSEELCQLLFQLLFSNHGPLLLKGYRENISGIVKWAENWNQVVRDDFFELCTNHSKKLKAI